MTNYISKNYNLNNLPGNQWHCLVHELNALKNEQGLSYSSYPSTGWSLGLKLGKG